MKPTSLILTGMLAAFTSLSATEFHVSLKGNDTNPGTTAAPLRTIQRAADLAQPGDTITVHEGIYRERVNPPRGGTSEQKRIVYQAAPGERVEIRGSEVVRNWVKAEELGAGIWKVVLPNSFFGPFNPYSDLIYGDWFGDKKRRHHTGAVYLNGAWLVEAASIGELIKPDPKKANQDLLLNVAWFQTREGGPKLPAVDFASQEGVQKAECSEGGGCLGYISAGDWVRFEGVDFGVSSREVSLRIASASLGGQIELRRDNPDGELLGLAVVPGTGGWQVWQSVSAKIKPLSGKQNLCLRFAKPTRPGARDDLKWFGMVDTDKTTIWAQFKGLNPNDELVEINARRTVFYPSKTGINFITVRGFGLRHAATPWAPPTSEQVGLIGTNWSRSWVLENNDISHSVCTAVTLGKYGDEWDNQSADTAEGYVKTIERALQNGWNKETVGHHRVLNNKISYCEQAGIVGSLGAAFSTVSGNEIHDIHVRALFGGAEMAAIKFHAAVDVEISRNRIYRTCLGIWLDWMAQGTHLTRNLLHENAMDLFTEVNHGPILADNNLFLSPGVNVSSNSQGVAYVHNLFAGNVLQNHLDKRLTPYLKEHGTEMVALEENPTGDHRFINNVFVSKADMTTFERATLPMQVEGNVFFKETKPWKDDTNARRVEADPAMNLVEQEDGVYLEMNLPAGWTGNVKRPIVTTDFLGTTAISKLKFVQPDGSPERIDTDYFGKKRNLPLPGPIEVPGEGKVRLKVW